MLFDFCFAKDWKLLVKRLVIVTLLRAGWVYLLSMSVERTILGGIIPHPMWVIDDASFFLSNPVTFFPAFMVPALTVLQLAILAGLARLLFLKEEAPATGLIIDGKKLRRAWWVTPVMLTITLTLTFFVIAGLIKMGRNSRYPMVLGRAIWMNDGTPFLLGMGFGVAGLAFGHRFNMGAKETFGGLFGIQYLAPDHWLTQRVHALAARLDLPPPAVGVCRAVNAFAMGESVKSASVVLGVPLVKGLAPDELDAVIGHELGHVVSGDMRQMQYGEGYQSMLGWAFTVVGVIATVVASAMAKTKSDARSNAALGSSITILGRWIIGFVGELLLKSLSRSREYYADAIGAALTSPDAMARALDKLEKLPASATPAESRYGYFMFRGSRFGSMFATHPTMQQRRNALQDRSRLRQLPMRSAG